MAPDENEGKPTDTPARIVAETNTTITRERERKKRMNERDREK